MNNTPLPSEAQAPSKGMSITSLVLGIISLLTGIAAIISIPLGIAALILGIMSINKGSKGMSIAGIITGSLGILVGLLSVLLIFIALPSLQRNQRDIATKNEVSSVMSAISSFRTNNQGAIPSQDDYLSEVFQNMYLSSPIQSDIHYSPGVDCSGVSNANAYSVSAKLESGNTFCLE